MPGYPLHGLNLFEFPPERVPSNTQNPGRLGLVVLAAPEGVDNMFGLYFFQRAEAFFSPWRSGSVALLLGEGPLDHKTSFTRLEGEKNIAEDTRTHGAEGRGKVLRIGKHQDGRFGTELLRCPDRVIRYEQRSIDRLIGYMMTLGFQHHLKGHADCRVRNMESNLCHTLRLYRNGANVYPKM